MLLMDLAVLGYGGVIVLFQGACILELSLLDTAISRVTEEPLERVIWMVRIDAENAFQNERNLFDHEQEHLSQHT